MLFGDLPEMLSPSEHKRREIKRLEREMVEREKVARERKVNGLRRCAVPVVFPVPVSRIKKSIGFIGPVRPPVPADFVGPYDLRPFMIKRGKAKAAEGSKEKPKARALPPMSWLSEVGTADRAGLGLAGIAAQKGRG